jgi:hypothetical protein
VSASHTVFSFSLDLCEWYQFSSEQSWYFNWSSLSYNSLTVSLQNGVIFFTE